MKRLAEFWQEPETEKLSMSRLLASIAVVAVVGRYLITGETDIAMISFAGGLYGFKGIQRFGEGKAFAGRGTGAMSGTST